MWFVWNLHQLRGRLSLIVHNEKLNFIIKCNISIWFLLPNNEFVSLFVTIIWLCDLFETYLNWKEGLVLIILNEKQKKEM